VFATSQAVELSGGHHERCQQWVKKAREKHLGTADTAGKATDETVQETLEKNAAVEKQVKIALARTVAEHCSSMNTEHYVSKKDASLKPGDFSSLKTLKLNEFDDLNPVSKRKMVNCVMTSLLRDPVSHAAILPALAVFFASNVNTAPAKQAAAVAAARKPAVAGFRSFFRKEF
jgi:hypothetical protein